MADDRSSNPAPASKPAGRTTPVLVPQGVLEGQPEIPLNRPVTTVGSNEGARLHLVSRTVSKGHALFVNSGGATYVADLASKSGVLVNGKLVQDAELKNGDRVQIGKFVFRYRLPANLAAAIQPIEAPPAAVIVVGWPALPVTGRVVSIGRGDRSDISLNTDAAVSAPHAAIFQVDGKWYIRDMNTRTGTHINGKAIHQSPLNFGDRIVIGSSTILFQPGAAIEDESFSSEIDSAPQEEEFFPPVEAPLAAVETAISPADEPIPLPEDDLPKIGDWKTAFPAAVDVPVEAASVGSTAPIPLDFVDPEPATVDWAATPAADVPATVETPTTSQDAPVEWAETEPVVAEQPAPVADDPVTWSATAATDLPAEKVPLELAEPEPVVAEQPAPIVDEPVTWGTTTATDDAPLELAESEPVIAEQPAPVVDEPVTWSATAATDLSAVDAPLELVEPEPVLAEQSAPVVDEPVTWGATAATDLPAEDALLELEEPAPVIAEDSTPTAAEPVTWDATATADLPVEDALPERVEAEPVVAEESKPVVDEAVTWGETAAAELPAGNAPSDLVESESAVAEVSKPAADEPVIWDAAAAVDLPVSDEPADLIETQAAEFVASASASSPTADVPLEFVDSEPLEKSAVNDVAAVDWNVADATELLAANLAQIEPVNLEPVEPSVAQAEPHAVEKASAEIESPHSVAAENELTPTEEIADWVVTPAPEFPAAEISVVEQTPLEDAAGEAAQIVEWAATPSTELPATTADLESIAVDHPMTEENLPAVDAEPIVEADITPTSATNLHVEESAAVEHLSATEAPREVEPEPVGEISWGAASHTDHPGEESAAVDDATVDNTAVDNAAVDNAAGDDTAVDSAAVDDATVDWHATPATDLPIEPITDVETVEALPVSIVPPIAIDPQTPVEDFIFDPAAEAVDPTTIPDELFFGDPEPEAVVVPSAIEAAPIEPAPIELPANDADTTFDAAIEESFTDHNPTPISLADVAEELSLPAGLAAFAKASLETAEPYIAAAAAEVPAAEMPSGEIEPGESIPEFIDVAAQTPLDTADDSAIGWSALSDEVESPAENAAPQTPSDVVDAEWTDDAKDGAVGWSAVVNHDALPAEADTETKAEAEVPFAEIEEDTAEGEEAIGWSALVEQDETPGDPHTTVTEGSTPATDEADLDFLDFSDQSPEVAPDTPAPSAPVDEAAKPEADPRGPAHGPSIFGFQFEGGSFLGGMPISLHQPTPEVPAVLPTIFDASRTSPSGLGAMTPPVTARSNRPMTPPRPDRSTTGGAAAAPALPGLISDAQSPWSVAPVIPPTARTEAKAPGRPKRGLTTAFNGPGMAARNTEVFSQLAAPIGVEVFGGKPGNPNQFTVPDSKETAAEAAAQAAALDAATAEPAAEISPKKRRRSRLPWLSLLFVGIPAGLWALTYLCPPVSSRLVSAKLLGSLQFDGLSGLSPEDVHAFHKAQEARLYSEEVRESAETILENKHQPAGFTASDDDFSKTVDTQSLNWSGNSLQFTFNTSDPAAGSAQVNAVLAALAQKDRDLDEAKARARAEADSARAAADETAANLQRLKEQRAALLVQAQDCPDAAIVNAGDQDAADLTQRYNDSHAIRQSSESVLADLRSQDPSKPIDIEADPKIVELKKRLDPLNEQIARLKGISAVGAKSTVGTVVSAGATTQPDADVDPLLAPLQQQADLLNQKLDQRRGELAADASMSPAQREVNMASRIENLSVKITALQKVENDAKAAADAAVATAKQNHDRVSAARLAGVKAEELYGQITQVDADHTRAVQAQSDKEAALANCVTVASAPMAVPLQLPTTDPRPPILALASGLSCVIFGLMIVGELRRPKLMTGVKPAAAPLVNPPVRVIPWPQPRELSGLESTGEGAEPPPVMGEPDQVFGGV